MWQFFIFMELNTFLIFCVYEDNESKYQEIDIRVDQQIFTQRKYQRIYRKRYPSSTRYEGGGGGSNYSYLWSWSHSSTTL